MTLSGKVLQTLDASLVFSVRPEREAASSYPPMQENSLMVATAEGDTHAFHLLMTLTKRRAWGFIWRYCPLYSDAEEILQEAYLKLWRQADQFNPAKGSFYSWFFRILYHSCMDHHRKKRYRETPLEATELIDTAPLPETQSADRDIQRKVQTAILRLPERQRLALILTHYEALSVQEAAAVMEISTKAAESLLVRARRELRESLLTLYQER
jgi:RNA polymerase sigma-70 factor (ECF subfamily)